MRSFDRNSQDMKKVNVIGGGLAGVEAAWQAARAGAQVRLFEMRPVTQTPAHRTDKFAELITEQIESNPNIELVREEVKEIDDSEITIIATGPLSSDALTADIMKLTGSDQLYFYDAIAPIVAADSIDRSIAFPAARYGKGGDDYLNCPFDGPQYAHFYSALIEAKSVPLHRFEETRWFESCLPIEELARRGVDTLRFGPMKPVGLVDPRTGREPYAAVQLRQENLMADA